MYLSCSIFVYKIMKKENRNEYRSIHIKQCVLECVFVVGYLEQFARNRRGKEKTEVLTARLPQSLYSDFKVHCDELGLSISEAVYLLVEHEMNGLESAYSEVATTAEKPNEYKKNDDVVVANTNVVKKVTKRSTSNTKRFTTKQWQVDDRLPCPICDKWELAKNYSRHAKSHEMTTKDIFTKEEYKDKINVMIEERKSM